MSAVFSSLPLRFVGGRAHRSGLRPLVLRTVLLAGSLAVALMAGVLAQPAAWSSADPELAFLLRGMAVIKASITVAAIGLALWRFGRPVSSPAASGYVVGIWSLVAANVLIGSLSYIPAAAFVFHVALFALLALAWREGGPRSSRREG
jgi:hypothetical protein